MVDSGALVVQVLAEAQLPVPAPLPSMPQLPGLAPLPGVAPLVVDSAPLLDVLSRQSYSAAMAGSTP